HAFLWQDGRMSDLGTLPGFQTSTAEGINASGHVVGYAWNSRGDSRPFLWTAEGMKDLNELIDPASDWVLETAWDINNHGQIVGHGTAAGMPRAYLLTPE